MVVIREGSGKDNGVVASVENPAITQEPVKRVEKRVVYRSKIIEFNYSGWLLCKVKIINKINSEAFLVKSGSPFKTSSEHSSSELGFKII